MEESVPTPPIECPICYNTKIEHSSSTCGHACCNECWLKMYLTGLHTCPFCRGDVSPHMVIPIDSMEHWGLVSLPVDYVPNDDTVVCTRPHLFVQVAQVVVLSIWVVFLTAYMTSFFV